MLSKTIPYVDRFFPILICFVSGIRRTDMSMGFSLNGFQA
jgi:hypothetical protein